MENKQFYETDNSTTCSQSDYFVDANSAQASTNVATGEASGADSTSPLLSVNKIDGDDLKNPLHVHVYDETGPDEPFNLPLDTTVYEPGGNDTAAYMETSYSDTGSYDSATLLIPSGETSEQCMPTPDTHLPDITVQGDTETIPYRDITDNVHKMDTIPERGAGQTYFGHSNVSIADDITMVEEITVTPLHIVGSGWEFGSLTSIHRRPVEAFRSRTNTMESKAESMRFKRDGDTDSRLLSRVFANQIAAIDLLKKSTDGIDIIDIKHSALSLSGKPTHVDVTEENPNTRNFKNIVAVSIGALLLLISMYGLRNLQSSMNSEGGIGVISMCIICTVYVFGSMVSPFAVQRFGPKRCLVLGAAAHLPYVFANYYATWLTIMPSSVIIGLGSALVWNSFSTYITETGILESHTKNKRSDHIISRYFGIFFMSIQMSMVIGNLISSLILVPKPLVDTYSQVQNKSVSDTITSVHNTSEHIHDYLITPSNQSQPSNGRVAPSSGHQPTCGIGFCNDDLATAQTVDDLDKLFLLGTYASCGILSVLVLQFCLDCVPTSPSCRTHTLSPRGVATQALAVVSMVTDKLYALIVPMCLYSYVSVGFVIADVLKAYVTCPLGIYMVGYMMICNGVFGSISSYTFGKLVRYTGRIPVFVTAAVINLAALAAMVTWRPTSGDIYYLFVCIGAWGFADGIWQSQINSLISTVFADRYETAFGTFRVLQGVAGMLVFGLSTFFCLLTKLAITAAVCIVSLAAYLVMELRLRRGHAVAKEIVVHADV